MAYIRKLPNGKHRAEIERNGIRESKVCETKREAQAWALEQEGTAKRARKGGNKSFGDAVTKYKDSVSSKKDGGVWEVRRLDVMLEHFKSSTPLIDIDTPDIANWRDSRLESVSASTVVREANLLRNLFNLARKEWKWMDNEPFLGVKLPKEGPPRTQLWTWRLIRRVLRAERVGKTKEMQEAFHIALRTGMRLAEVLQAPDNFDRKKRVVTIKTKTEAVARIPIGRIASKLLVRKSFIVGPNEGSTLFARLCKELLITDLTFHDTRGTALTHLSRKVDVLTLAKISRHKDLSLLSNVYYRETADSIAHRI
jgi:integrase